MHSEGRRALAQWVQDETCMVTTWVRQNQAPRPKYPYCTLDLTADNRARHESAKSDTSGPEIDRIYRIDVSSTVRIRCYRRLDPPHDYCDEAYFTLAALRDSIVKESVKDRLRAGEIAIQSFGTLNDLTAIVGPDQLSQAELVLTVGYTAEITDTVPYIETVETGQRVVDPGGNIVLDSTITIG